MSKWEEKDFDKSRKAIEEKVRDILGSVDHGECFYDKDDLKNLMQDISELDAEATQYYYHFND